jgi:glycosyltransferase involved in cell wall biosynthesis
LKELPNHISVIIPTYNREKYINECISSILNQSLSPSEILVIDDGSTDRTREVVLGLNDARIKYIQQNQSGPSIARNNGIKQAKGDIIAFLDSDDMWEDTFLEKMVGKLLSGNYGLVYCEKKWIDEHGNVMHDRTGKTYFPEGDVFLEMFNNAFINSTSCVVLKKSCLEKTGYFPENQSHSEDYALWLKIAKNFSIGAVHDELVRYRWHPDNLMKSRAKLYHGMLRTLENVINIEPVIKNPDRAAIKKRLKQIYILALSDLFSLNELNEMRKFGFDALQKHYINLKILYYFLLSFLPVRFIAFARKVKGLI